MGALDSTYGALLMGAVASGVLYGCASVQTWNYFTRYPSDRWYFKLTVASTFVADTINQILIVYTGKCNYAPGDMCIDPFLVYTYLVTNWGLSEELGKVLVCLCHTSLVHHMYQGYTTFSVQCFLAMRVYKLSNKSLVSTASVMVLVVAQFLVVLGG
ncbi:hypothetical protein JVT61DRAFT_13164 [Boletus reticuloceps]|uniref:Uncharacterized protein n=1 Tax=Boletus reticuloceps TaxID=495285 RepID=A0A8I2YXS1_9AGAM|nr:hypothetical protein JVT61DRAFT_13164 [Boletus reticuloceps]